MTQSGNRTVNPPAGPAKTRKDKETPRGRAGAEPERMVSRAAPEPAPPIAKASLFVMAPQLETKHDFCCSCGPFSA